MKHLSKLAAVFAAAAILFGFASCKRELEDETPVTKYYTVTFNTKGGSEVQTYHDHRLAMSLYVASLICKKEILINGFEWVGISFPEFEEYMQKLILS